MRARPDKRSLWLLFLFSATLGAAERAAFKVCADPHSLPSSNHERRGYENEIARVFAEDLGLPLRFEWFPQRIGFIRNTLRNKNPQDGSYKCDVVMGVPEKFELAATTKPYMRTSWSLIFVKGRGLDRIRAVDDLVQLPPEQRRDLKIGSFDRSPATAWMAEQGLLANLKPYQSMNGDSRSYPGQIIENELLNGDLDAVFIFGPIAGYFARQTKEHELIVMPMRNISGRFEYQIAMAVRHGEREWLATINELIDKHQTRIDQILVDYGVPLLSVE